MSTLDTMFQNGMKNSGAMALGQMLPVEQQTQQAQLEAQQLANQSNAQMNPLRAQLMQGQIDQQQAQLPGILGQSQSQAAQGQVDQATTSARIAERLSTLGNQVGVDQMQQMGRDGQIALAAAKALDNYPVYMHKQVVANIAKQYGVDPSNPLIAGVLANPDDQVKGKLAALGQGMAMASADFMQKSVLQSQELASRERQTAGNNAATITAAKIGADSRVQAAELRIQQMMQHMNTDQKMAYLSDRIASGDATDAERAQYADLQAKKVQQRAAGINPLGAQMTGQQTPTQAAVATGGFGAPQAGPNNTGAVQTGAIPPGAIQMLKANPNLRDAFDAKYGAGASKSILGN